MQVQGRCKAGRGASLDQKVKILATLWGSPAHVFLIFFAGIGCCRSLRQDRIIFLDQVPAYLSRAGDAPEEGGIV